MGKQLGFYLNANTCTGCKACVIACKDKNNLPLGINWRHVVQYGGGTWLPHPTQKGVMMPSQVYAYAVSVACNHCEHPMCTQVCPTGAMAKRADGVVLVNQDQCIGCRYCEWACPYDGPKFDERIGKMTKCNACEDLLAEGKNPACVDACVMRALEFGDLAVLRGKYGTENGIAPLPEAQVTWPSLVITPHKHAQASGNGTGRILDLVQEV